MGRKKMSDKTQTQNEGTAQKTIEGSTHVGGQEIQAVTTEDDRDILGWIVPFTIGNDFVVPRDWLEQRARELNLSPNVLPSPTSEKRAFTRAGGRVDGRQVAEIEKKENVDLHLEKVRYKRIYHLEVHDRREEGEFDGEVIGVLKFEDDELDVRPKVTPEHEMWDAWNAYVGAFKDEFDLMANSNLGEDIRHMITNLFQSRSWSVKFRAGGGVYFAPPAIEGVVKAIDQLITDIDREHKKAGFPCELDTIEVAATSEKKSMVEEKVARNLEEQVADIIEDAFDEIADDDTLVDDVVDDVENELDDVDDFTSQYNALLDAEMTVREHLEEWQAQATGEAQELVDELLDVPEDDDDEDDDDQASLDEVAEEVEEDDDDENEPGIQTGATEERVI